MIEKIIILGLLASLLGAVIMSWNIIRRYGEEDDILSLLFMVAWRFFFVLIGSATLAIGTAILGPLLLVFGVGWVVYALFLAPPQLIGVDGEIVVLAPYFEVWLANHRRAKQEMRELFSQPRAQ